MTKLLPLDLEKKSRELTEREQVLNAREDLITRESALNKRQKVFTEVEAKLDVLNKQIKAKEDILTSKNFAFEEFTKASEDKIASLKSRENVVLQSISLRKNELSDIQEQMSIVAKNIKAKKNELADINQQIKDTKKYGDEQSKLVENTISEWNNNLVEFRAEADLIQNDKNKLSADIIRLEQDKAAIAIELDKEQSKLESLDGVYEDKAEVYRSSLRALEVEVSQKRNELESVINATNMRLKEVETREKSVRLKEISTNQRENTLDQKERRLKMNYGIAGIDYGDAI